MKICIDPGHGGIAPGACANGIVEEDSALELALRIGHNVRLRGGETYLTREKDTSIGINDRPKKAIAKGCTFLLSIHHDAAENPNAHGITAYVVEEDYPSKREARKILDKLKAAGFAVNGIRWDSQSQHSRLGVLRGFYQHGPAILLEIGFLTSPIDARMLKDKHKREAIAVAISQAITGKE